MMKQCFAILFGLALSLATIACKNSSTAQASSGTTSPAPARTAAPKVAKIIFVGKEHACDCTRKALDAGWAALQKALGTPAKLPVERLQIDTQGDQVAPYRGQKPIMALPAIYFVDGKNTVLELLQGEVTSDQVAKALADAAAAR